MFVYDHMDFLLHDASHSSMIHAVAIVCLSLRLVFCVKMTKCIIKLFSALASAIDVFFTLNILAKSPQQALNCTGV